MDDLVERLRTYRPTNEWGDGVHHVICDEAADRITALTAERDEARALMFSASEASQKHLQMYLDAEDRAAEARAKVIAEVVAWLNNASIWLNGGECCGQKCSDGVCCAPACIWGDELKLLHSVATALETGEWKK